MSELELLLQERIPLDAKCLTACMASKDSLCVAIDREVVVFDAQSAVSASFAFGKHTF
jgi:hypothetical protein